MILLTHSEACIYVHNAQTPRGIFVDFKHIAITLYSKESNMCKGRLCTTLCYISFIYRFLQLPAPVIHSSTSSVDTNYEPEYSPPSRKASAPPLNRVLQPDVLDKLPRILSDAPLGIGAQMQMLTSTLSAAKG